MNRETKGTNDAPFGLTNGWWRIGHPGFHCASPRASPYRAKKGGSTDIVVAVNLCPKKLEGTARFDLSRDMGRQEPGTRCTNAQQRGSVSGR